ncbi:hypothetical protein QE152_g30011 [Popillia japonica]|uniref:DDE-1 domain-containing protein n=1 Tax=Popillia japonica TaxID=7064 RepID=A0AAW1JFU2_POPJA
MVAPEHAESVTVVGCINAVGNSIPPMVIFKGKRLKEEFKGNLPPGSLVTMSPKGYMTTELFVVFIGHLAKYRTADSTLLIFDGVKTILTTAFNTTHELQPLDKAVYRSFEFHWDQEVLRYWHLHPDRRLTKTTFNVIFSKVWPKCTTPENIISGFRFTGIFPFDPTAIPEVAFAPSLLTERPHLDDLDEHFEEEDNIPLAQLFHVIRNNSSSTKRNEEADHHNNLNASSVTISDSSFHDLLPTPTKYQEKPRNTDRKKALNYKPQVVTKDLFSTSTPKARKEKENDCLPSTSTL